MSRSESLFIVYDPTMVRYIRLSSLPTCHIMKHAETRTHQTSDAVASGINIYQRAHPSESGARGPHSSSRHLSGRRYFRCWAHIAITPLSVFAGECLEDEAMKGIWGRNRVTGTTKTL